MSKYKLWLSCWTKKNHVHTNFWLVSRECYSEVVGINNWILIYNCCTVQSLSVMFCVTLHWFMTNMFGSCIKIFKIDIVRNGSEGSYLACNCSIKETFLKHAIIFARVWQMMYSLKEPGKHNLLNVCLFPQISSYLMVLEHTHYVKGLVGCNFLWWLSRDQCKTLAS